MDVIGTDASIVKGTHGRIFSDPLDGPVFLSSTKRGAAGVVSALEVKQRILDLVC